jgi:hypothetical protein
MASLLRDLDDAQPFSDQQRAERMPKVVRA